MPYVRVYRKPEFPPLLPLGWHSCTLDELRVLCVDGFPASSTRERIMCGVEHVFNILCDASMKGRVWVDGSFLTNKIDPDDSDLVLCMASAFSDHMTPEQAAVEDWFQDRTQVLHRYLRCHNFAIARWPEGDSNYDVGEWNYAYWLRQWGFSQSDVAKGIAVLELP